MTIEQRHLLAVLREIVGRRDVLTGEAATRAYRFGYRFGSGCCLAVVRPNSLVELWDVASACVDAGVIVIMQAANTSLTGGATPDGAYDRHVVIVTTQRLRGLHLLYGGEQVVALPGATLNQLERRLRTIGREPHSVIGSSCVGASVVGGVCNNSGGALIQRGPAFTQMALYAQVDARGRLNLVNNLGVRLSETPRLALDCLERGAFSETDVESAPERSASDLAYANEVRRIDAETPARFNADPARLFGASGSAGRLIVFAVRLDTFPTQGATKTYYVGADAPATLTDLRRHMLAHCTSLPISAEYMHRDAFRLAERYGKDTFLAVSLLGPDRLPAFFRLKASFDGLTARLPWLGRRLSDRVMQWVMDALPSHLPQRLRHVGKRFEHQLILKLDLPASDELGSYLSKLKEDPAVAVLECTPEEAQKAALHRFAVAGAAIRYRAVHSSIVEDLISLDVALRRNDRDWVERLPDDIADKLIAKIYYGHFFCHVFHQDYLVAKGHDAPQLEGAICEILDGRGAEYPAEHNVGHIYKAKPQLASFYRSLDPTNCLNPGIGRTSRAKHWR